MYVCMHICILGGCPLSGKSSMCMMCLKYRIILLIVIKNPWVILLTSGLLFDIAPALDLVPYRHLAVNVATAVYRWRHLRDNCRIKIGSKNRNCGDAIFFFFCRKKQRTNAKSERSKCRGLAICRRRQLYAMIGVELRTCG